MRRESLVEKRFSEIHRSSYENKVYKKASSAKYFLSSQHFNHLNDLLQQLTNPSQTLHTSSLSSQPSKCVSPPSLLSPSYFSLPLPRPLQLQSQKQPLMPALPLPRSTTSLTASTTTPSQPTLRSTTTQPSLCLSLARPQARQLFSALLTPLTTKMELGKPLLLSRRLLSLARMLTPPRQVLLLVAQLSAPLPLP